MATNVTKATGEDYRGFIVPDIISGVTYDPAFTSANPRPGNPESIVPTDMVLESSGQTSTLGLTQRLVIETSQGGMPGFNDARFLWNYDRTGAVRGWDTPSAIAEFEGSIGANADVNNMTCLSTQAQSILLAAIEPATGSGDVLRIYRRATSGTWTSTISISSQWNNAKWDAACLMQLPEGRIHLYALQSGASNYSEAVVQLRLHISDDDGVSWSSSDSKCLGAPPSTSFVGPIKITGTVGTNTYPGSVEIRRMRCAYNHGQVMLLIAATLHDDTALPAGVAMNCWFQYAASDLGHNFDYITTYFATSATDEHAGGFHDIIAHPDGNFVVCYVSSYYTVGNIAHIICKRFASAYQEWSTVPTIQISGLASGTRTVYGANYEMYYGHLGAAMDSNGEIWVTSKYIGTLEDKLHMSYDGGVTWKPILTDYVNDGASSSWWTDGTTGGTCTGYPEEYTACFQRGRFVVIALNATMEAGDNGGYTHYYRPMAFYLGGYTSITRPFNFEFRTDDNQMSFDENWVALEKLANTSTWVRTAVGAGSTENLITGTLRITTNAVSTLNYRNSVITANSAFFFGLFDLGVTTGSTTIKVKMSNGAQGFDVDFKFTGTTVTCTDVVSATLLSTISNINVGGLNQLYVVIDRFTRNIRYWYRGTNTSEDRFTWQSSPTHNLTDSGAVAVANYVNVAIPINTGVNFNILQFGSGNFGEAPVDSAPSTNTSYHKFGRSYSTYPTYVASDISIHAVDGPSWANQDSWEIVNKYDYGFDNVNYLIAASPKKTWRSAYDSVDHIVTLSMDGTYEKRINGTLAIAGFNCNFKTMNVEVFDGAAFVLVGVLDFSTGMTGLSYFWEGLQVAADTVGTLSTADRYFTTNILEDSHFALPHGSSPALRIAGNSDGAWGQNLDTVHPILNVELPGLENDIDGEIWSKDGVLLIHDCPPCSYIRLTIPAQQTAEGFFEIGTLIIGHVEYFGKQYARGRAIASEQNYNMTTGRSGTRTVRRLGDARRTVEFSWQNENNIDSTQITIPSPDPDYIVAATGSTRAVASPAATAHKMSGLIDQLGGATTPVVYLSKIPVEAAEDVDTCLTNRNLFMLCRITSNPRIETVLGSEWGKTKGEVCRVANILLEEEL